MNEIVNKFLFTGDKIMLELHLRQPGFIYSACGAFTEYHESNRKIKETGDLNYIYKKKLDEACFAHDAAHADNKDVTKRTVSGKVLKGRAYKIALNTQYD